MGLLLGIGYWNQGLRIGICDRDWGSEFGNGAKLWVIWIGYKDWGVRLGIED